MQSTEKTSPAPPMAPVPPEAVDSRLRKRGMQCAGLNKGFLKYMTGAVSVLHVLSSPRVPNDVFASRMEEGCKKCPHVTVYDLKGDGVYLHYCQCCGCPKWSVLGVGSDLETKCEKAAWKCPRPEPAFGAWKG